MIDLHMHTTCSDGQFSPEETMRMAHEAGVTVAAVTDHDTASGISRARAAAEQYGMTFFSYDVSAARLSLSTCFIRTSARLLSS